MPHAGKGPGLPSWRKVGHVGLLVALLGTLTLASIALGASGRSVPPPSGALVQPGTPLALPQMTWINVTGQIAGAPALTNASWAYEPGAKAMFLYGGYDNTAGTAYEFNGTGWTEPTQNGALPGAREEAGMAYNPANAGEIVMLGGFTFPPPDGGGQVPDHETWEWTNSTSTWAGPNIVLSYRAGDSMVWDPAMNADLVFGGCGWISGTGVLSGCMNDTWVLNGTTNTWTNLTGQTGPTPPARGEEALVYDPLTSEVLMFGGWNGTAALGDTWAFKGGNWSQVVTNAAPSPRYSAGATWDSSLGRLVLFGGCGNRVPCALNDTWTYGSGQWARLPTHDSPPARYGGLLTGFPGETVDLFGGSSQTYPRNDTWTLRPILQVSALATPKATDLGQSVALTSTISGGWGPYRELWDLGDGTNSSLPNVTYVYRAVGTYLVNLTVTDSEGQVAVAHLTVVISAVPTLSASVTPGSGDAPLNVTYVAAPSGGTAPWKYVWKFGDGGGSSNASGVYAYAGPGTYPVQVWANDSGGATLQDAFSVTVNPMLGVSLQVSPSSVEAGHRTWINATAAGGSGSGYAYAWQLNGTPIAGVTAGLVVTPPGPGNDTYTVTVTDSGGGMAHASALLEVLAPLRAQVSLSSSSVTTETPVTATCTVSGLANDQTTYSWTLNGTSALTGTGPTTVVTLAHGGNYTIVVQVTNDDRITTAQAPLTVTYAPLVSALQAFVSSNRTSLEAGGSVTITASVSGGLTPYLYTWALNGTNVSSPTSRTWGLELPHAGTYAFQVWVQDSVGHLAVSTPVSVKVTPAGSVTTTPPPSGGSSTTTFAGLALVTWLLILLLVAIVVIVLAFAMGRRTRDEGLEGEAGVPVTLEVAEYETASTTAPPLNQPQEEGEGPTEAAPQPLEPSPEKEPEAPAIENPPPDVRSSPEPVPASTPSPPAGPEPSEEPKASGRSERSQRRAERRAARKATSEPSSRE